MTSYFNSELVKAIDCSEVIPFPFQVSVRHDIQAISENKSLLVET
jgi:hypothetical protein